MNGINTPQPRTLPRHLRIRPPYNRQDNKKDLVEQVLEYFSDNGEQQRPLTFCSGLNICFYATANCLYGKKSCYYE
jgi:hypothetical protein